jgi:flavin-dependent dehydrogenase
MNTDYEVITVGGGLGGSVLAKVLAESGARVLVIERESQFKDRVRGEWMAPWGVAEAQKLESITCCSNMALSRSSTSS